MTDAEIAGYMGWTGPGAYTQHQMKRIRRIVDEVQRRDREQAAQQAPKPDGRKIQRMRQEAWRQVSPDYKDDPELCFALGFDAGYGAVAPRVEPPAMESGGGFESRPASAQQKEPVAYAIFAPNGNIRIWSTEPQHVKRIAEENGLSLVKLYTSPPASKPMTDEQIGMAFRKAFPVGGVVFTNGAIDFARAIEAAHDIKGQP